MCLLAFLVQVVCFPALSTAQFIRLGVVDMSALAGFGITYSSNVEGVRSDETEEEQEDIFFSPSLELTLDFSPALRNTELTLVSSISAEEYVERTDLNTRSDPFADLQLDSLAEFGRFTLGLNAGYSRDIPRKGTEIEDSQRVFTPGGETKRDIVERYTYGGDLAFQYSRFSAYTGLQYLRERHTEIDFREGDSDLTAFQYGAAYDIFTRLTLSYDHTQDREEIIHDPDAFDGWDDTDLVGLTVLVHERPEFNYTLGYEKEDSQGVEGEWEVIHIFSLDDEVDLFGTPAMQLTGSAAYTIEEDEEEGEDIEFVYDVMLTHIIGRTLEHSVTFARRPVRTFGTTTDTDETEYVYSIDKTELFFSDTSLNFQASYRIDDPLASEDPTEKTLAYLFDVSRTTEMGRNFDVTLSYTYLWEDLDVEPEILEEHRVTLLFNYSFGGQGL